MNRMMVESFNTHRMADEVVQALATGREDELARIVDAVRSAASDPAAAPPALVVYGERGSGKSFLLRLVQIECGDMEGVACILLPEEQYNIRSVQQVLQIVTAHVKGRDWSTLSYQIDPRGDEDAWREDLEAFHAALDDRFGSGRGVALVLLENFDALVLKLFGAAPAKGKASSPAVARRLAEERLRKLLGARSGRFMLVASATGTVDMDYERPLFNVFMPIDLKGWSADTSIVYYNRRRELEGQPPLDAIQEARARAITEFIGGNPRLAQLLGTVLNSPCARTIANTMDELVDHLADYYRRRLDDLPHASAAVLDAMIRGGDPVSQSTLAARMGGDQRQIADAFSYLVRGRLVQARREIGGSGQLYRVKDRLFVHFYRRRYGNSGGLGAIAELLESYFTPREREQLMRHHMELGEVDDAHAFGRLRLGGDDCELGSCGFLDAGITDGPSSRWFELVGLGEADTDAKRREIQDAPVIAAAYWTKRAEEGGGLLHVTAALALAAVAECRDGRDPIAQHLLDKSMIIARNADDADAMIVAIDAAATFYWNRVRNGGTQKALELLASMEEMAQRATRKDLKFKALTNAAFYAYYEQRYAESVSIVDEVLNSSSSPSLKMTSLYVKAHALIKMSRFDKALRVAEALLQLAKLHNALIKQRDALDFLHDIFGEMGQHEKRLQVAIESVAIATDLGMIKGRATAYYFLADCYKRLGQLEDALAAVRAGLDLVINEGGANRDIIARLAIAEGYLLLDQKAPSTLVVQKAEQAVDYANNSGNTEIVCDGIALFIYAAAFSASSRVVELLSSALDQGISAQLLDEERYVKNNWLWAIAHSQDWEGALTLVQRYSSLNDVSAELWQSVARTVGVIWSKNAVHHGRAAAYAQSCRDIKAISAIIIASGQESLSISGICDSLARSLSASCNDYGYLLDIADILETQSGKGETEAVGFLRQFAELHAATDKERHLQYVDPDLAIAMRRVWSLPETTDTLAKRGRKRMR